MERFLWVGLGGACGAVLRYGISLMPYKGTFPVLTFITNLTGAVLIGLVAGLALRRQLGENLQLFLKTGVCGGFTTFSTFSLESFTMMEQGNYGIAGAYMGLSLVCCTLGVAAGIYVGKCLTGV